ncbi:MAG: hypothetical protein LC739_12890 [Actinobacteria bacterium]|nr:hypothetical protein [Actinomycetota bacterium]
MGSIISGTGMAIPERVVTNDDLSEIMDTTDEWISSRSGVKQRHLSLPGHGSSELAAHAGTAAIKDAGLHKSQIDALITATMTPDYYAPGIVALVQERIGLGAIPAFDLRQQCCGFLYGLDLADSLITSDRAENALVVGAEAHVGFIPWGKPKSDGSLPVPDEKQREVNNRTRGWSVLFGDGSGAMVVRRGEGNDGVIASRLFTDGSQPGLILVPGVGSVHLFHELRQQGQVGPGALVCFTAFGAGAHWGAVLYREPEANPPARN